MSHGLLSHTSALQLEGIALDPHAEDGKGSIGSTEALNLDFTQPQATQGMSVPKVTFASDHMLYTWKEAYILGNSKCALSLSESFHIRVTQARAAGVNSEHSRLLDITMVACA